MAKKEKEVIQFPCDACGKGIEDYPETLGGKGFVSPLSDELNADKTKAVDRIVCKQCYIKEWKKKNPQGVCPIK